MNHNQKTGFTLVELLVTLTILAILAVLVIPSMRMLSRDRKVRDTARVVGASFAAAREQAAVDGLAGVRIETNSNIANSGTTIYRLRSQPPVTGDVIDHVAVVTGVVAPPDNMTPGTAVVTFFRGANPLPLTNSVTVLDEIELNNSGVFYRITGTSPAPPNPTNNVVIQIEPSEPLPPADTALPFKIHSRPIPIQSSVLELPNRLFLHLSLSGHGTSGTQFDGADAVEVWFDANGAVDRIENNGTMEFPQGSVFLLLCTGDGDEVNTSNINSNLADPDTLQFVRSDNNMWIVIERKNGNISIGRMGNIDPTTPDIVDARSLARNRRSATP